MDVKDVLSDAFGRIREEVHSAVDGLSPEHIIPSPLDERVAPAVAEAVMAAAGEAAAK